MMSKFSFAARVAALLGTSWLLIATSPRPPGACPVQAPVTFQMTGTCGPSGEITAENDEACQVQAQRADAINFPRTGFAADESTILTGEWTMNEYGLKFRVPGGAQGDAGLDGGIDDSDGGTVDAGAAVDGGTHYKPGAEYETCHVTPTGTAGILTFECYDLVTAEPACTGRLEQKP